MADRSALPHSAPCFVFDGAALTQRLQAEVLVGRILASMDNTQGVCSAVLTPAGDIVVPAHALAHLEAAQNHLMLAAKAIRAHVEG